MCGIIGILGRNEVVPLLVEGLRRLEYRGYDSAGIATLGETLIKRRRAKGKLVNLENKLADRPIGGITGIGHTRWATHCAPTEENAHPHMSASVAVVHNGIIENFQEIKSEFETEGVEFETDTVTEVVVHLLTRALNEGKRPQEAMAGTMDRLRGAFALAIILAGHHDIMLGGCQGCPLAIGYGDGEMFLGSDAMALAPLTRQIAYLEEGDWVEISPDGAIVHGVDGGIVEREIRETATSGALIGKGKFRHFMQKEIYELQSCRARGRPAPTPIRFGGSQPHHLRRLRHRFLCRHGRPLLARAYRADAGRYRCRF